MASSSTPPLAARLMQVGFWVMLAGSVANLVRRVSVGNDPAGPWGPLGEVLRIVILLGAVVWVVGRVWAWRAGRP